jgi:hypothetical protein
MEAVVKLLGIVNAEPNFGDHPKVISGCAQPSAWACFPTGQWSRSKPYCWSDGVKQVGTNQGRIIATAISR